MNEKKCHKCHQVKPVGDFCRCSDQNDGLQTWCKPCIAEYKRAWRASRRTPELIALAERTKRNRTLVLQGLKQCSLCNQVKSLDDFWMGEGTGGYRGECMECRIARPGLKNYSDKRPRSYATAQRTAWGAIHDGRIKRPEHCQSCGKTMPTRKVIRIHFHHTDGYDKAHWYTGLFVCTRCHRKIHDGKLQVTGINWLP